MKYTNPKTKDEILKAYSYLLQRRYALDREKFNSKYGTVFKKIRTLYDKIKEPEIKALRDKHSELTKTLGFKNHNDIRSVVALYKSTPKSKIKLIVPHLKITMKAWVIGRSMTGKPDTVNIWAVRNKDGVKEAIGWAERSPDRTLIFTKKTIEEPTAVLTGKKELSKLLS
jgi:hypothetical protein